MKTYEITFAWRSLEDGEIGPEFTRTTQAMSEDQAVEIAESAINSEQDSHPDFGLEPVVNELELRGVKLAA